MKTIKLLGIDAAFANTGMALCEYELETGSIIVNELRLCKTEADKANKKVVRKNSDDLRRTSESIDALDQAIDEFAPSFAICEVPTGTQSARSAWCLGIAVGVIGHVAKRVPLIQVTPKEVKDVTGLKFPDKAEMIEWASTKHPGANWPMQTVKGVKSIVAGKAEHMADAVAVVHAGVRTTEFRGYLNLRTAILSGNVAIS